MDHEIQRFLSIVSWVNVCLCLSEVLVWLLPSLDCSDCCAGFDSVHYLEFFGLLSGLLNSIC